MTLISSFVFLAFEYSEMKAWNFEVSIGSSSIYRGELSFLQLVHFCICWCNNAVLTGYLFQQWLACVCVPNWENVLGVNAVIRCVW